MTIEEQKIVLLVHRIKDNCYEVAENLLKEHDKQIREDAIEEYFNKFDEWIKSNSKLSYFWTEFEVEARKIAEELKGNK